MSERAPDTLYKRDTRRVPKGAGEIRCFIKARDEALRLPHLLDHHRRLGVHRFFVIDNGSEDGTLDFLLGQPDVHVYAVSGSFSAARAGTSWQNSLMDVYGDGHWCVVVDADELLVYPEVETVGLDRLTAYLDAREARVVFALMLDMFSEGPIRDAHLRPGQPFLEACPFFDPAPYDTGPIKPFPGHRITGGPRQRVFWEGRVRTSHPPVLSKLPLIRWTKGLRYANATHAMADALPLADIRAVLLHFKFLSDFPAVVERAVERGEYFSNAREYRCYREVLDERPDLSLHGPGSLRYEDSAQLERLGLLMSSAAYRGFVAGGT